MPLARPRRAFALTLAALAATLSTPGQTQDGTQAFLAGMKRVPTPDDQASMPLYEGAAPGSERARQKEVWTEVRGELWIRNVTRPTLKAYWPKRDSGNGAAVLVVPGGGFKFVSISNEGWPIGWWLAQRGITAFVLKYRTDETPDSEADFGAEMGKMFATPPSDTTARLATASVERARDDAQAALRLIRANAEKWQIDPTRVGMIGFSAGAMTTLATALADAPDARPDFIAPIYGNMTPITPPSRPQPMFVALAADDPLFNRQGFGLVESWQKAGGAVELHYYSGGSHGFGSHTRGTTSDLWFGQFMSWMEAQGLLKSKGS
jgi:acetyl esterase/lipase